MEDFLTVYFTPQTLPQYLQAFGSLTIGCGTIIGACLLRNFNRSKQDDERNREFADLHCRFWQNEVFSRIRTMLVVDEAYTPYRQALQQRLDDRKGLTTEQHLMLDEIDRFVLFVIRADAVRRRYDKSRWFGHKEENYVEPSLFEYWLRQIVMRRRVELFAYVATFHYMLPRAQKADAHNGEQKRKIEVIRKQLGPMATDKLRNGERDEFKRVLLSSLVNRRQIQESMGHFQFLNDLLPGAYPAIAASTTNQV